MEFVHCYLWQPHSRQGVPATFCLQAQFLSSTPLPSGRRAAGLNHQVDRNMAPGQFKHCTLSVNKFVMRVENMSLLRSQLMRKPPGFGAEPVLASGRRKVMINRWKAPDRGIQQTLSCTLTLCNDFNMCPPVSSSTRRLWICLLVQQRVNINNSNNCQRWLGDWFPTPVLLWSFRCPMSPALRRWFPLTGDGIECFQRHV